ncbi:MAG: AraC family transcriptional regulator [Planctomycetota bacterium]|jgi:AraC-like DNA-binding protein
MKKKAVKKQDAYHEKKIYASNEFPILARFARQTVETRDTRLAYHRELEIQFIKSGKGSYFIKNRNYEFQKNSLFFIQPNFVHGFIPHQELQIEKAMVMFPLELLSSGKMIYQIPENFPNHIILPERESVEVEILFDNIVNEHKEKQTNWQELITLQLKHLVIIVKRLQLAEQQKEPENQVISWITDHIENNFAEDLTLPEIAEKAGYSKYYISRLFKHCTGLGMKQYILQRRILESKLLLNEKPDLTVDAISEMVGFKEFSLFNRSFKQYAGMTPSAYRKISHRDDNI